MVWPRALPTSRRARAGAVGDDVGHLGGVQPAVALVDVLDDLLAPARLDVDVDVRRAVAGRREEPLEEQAERDGVDVGDAERVADGRRGGRAPTLAEDVLAPAELDDVPHGQEVPREPERPDHPELVVDLPVGAGHPLGPPAARSGRPPPAGSARPARSARCGPPARGSRGGGEPPDAGRRRTRRPARRPARPPPATGRTGGAARPRPAGRRWPTTGATPPGPRGSAGPARPTAWWPGGTGPGWRSGRCWWPPATPPARRPARPARRCAGRRSACRGPTARRPRARRRSGRSGGRGPAPAAAGPSSVRAAASGPLRHPVRICQWPPWRSARASRVRTGRPSHRPPGGPRRWPG